MRLFFALFFSVWAAPAAAQAPSLFPLDRFWTHTLDAPFAAAPAADDRRVYVALGTGQLVAIDPRTDATIWSVELAVDGALLLGNGRVFVPAADAIHALDAATGTLAWRLPTGALAAPLVHRGGWLILSLAGGGLQGVRTSDGVVVWSRQTTSPVASAPDVDGDLLVAALADGRILAMDVTSGRARWERRLGTPAGSLTVSGDRIFAGTADGSFWSLEAKDGDLDWRWPRDGRLIGAAAADAERVYTVSLDNVVRAYSRDSGHMQWNHPLPTRPLGGPRLAGGLLIVTGGDMGAPGLTYIDAATGRAAGKTPALMNVEETTRSQFPVDITSGSSPLALIATATTAGGWQLHAYRQTFFAVGLGPLKWGPRYEVQRRLDIWTGAIGWGIRVSLAAPVATETATQ